MLVKWQPFGSLLDGGNWIDDFVGSRIAPRTSSFEPRIEIKENDSDFAITAELPGLNKDDFKLTVENDHLTLEGEKKVEHEDKNDGYYRSERSYGAFKRTFRLTNSVDKKNIKADYKIGILVITVPKSKEAKPKAVEINVN
jgi:HSP20 family protein